MVCRGCATPSERRITKSESATRSGMVMTSRIRVMAASPSPQFLRYEVGPAVTEHGEFRVDQRGVEGGRAAGVSGRRIAVPLVQPRLQLHQPGKQRQQPLRRPAVLGLTGDVERGERLRL